MLGLVFKNYHLTHSFQAILIGGWTSLSLVRHDTEKGKDVLSGKHKMNTCQMMLLDELFNEGTSNEFREPEENLNGTPVAVTSSHVPRYLMGT